MKKIISFVMSAMMLLLSVPSMADCDNEEDIMSLLSELNIMVGDADGNLRLDDYVSRAEFAKIAVASSKSKNTIAAGIKVSPFKDVTYKHWSAPYVRAAVSAGIVAGYVDATFKPDNTVSYEEALTMVLKVLGYTDDDFGYSWPYGQMGLADNLEITKNVNANQGDMLTRRQVANLIYNALNTKMKDSQSKLISVFDCEVVEGVTIIASNKEDSSLGTDKIYTTAGMYEFNDNFNFDYVGRQGDIVVKNGDDFVSFTPRDQQVEEYKVSNVIGSDIVLDGNMYNINSNTTTYYKSKTMTYELAAAEADKGDTFKLFKNANGSVDYAMLVSQSAQTGTKNFEKYVIYSQLADAVIGYNNGSFEQIDITDGTTCYKESIKSTYAAVKNEMAMGDILYVKRDGNSVEYVSYEKGSMEGPIRVAGTNWMSSFETNDKTAIMRNGNKVSASEIQINDI
ncbi:MAG: S-layer homology domain-containing protein, partial [Clostridia bacterium]|nr:S-layer homology domain-containing protein [Clostridia bacterium]